jgi:hypothetical protein
MYLKERKSKSLAEAVIELVEGEDWKVLSNDNKFSFSWIKEKGFMVHKIRLAVEEKIIGLISLEDIPKEFRIHIRLIEVNASNRGKHKEYEGVAGCLIAFTCRLAFEKGYDGFVSLYPKTALIEHYKEHYGFKEFGKNLYSQLANSERLIEKYLNRNE